MPFDPTKVPAHLIQAAQQHTLVPFVGVGVSRQTGYHFPTWHELIRIMIDYALAQGYIAESESKEMLTLLAEGQSLIVTAELRDRLPIDAYQKILVERFRPASIKPAEIHKALFRLRPPLILTTNYDTLLEDAYASEFGRRADDSTYSQPAVALHAISDRREQYNPVISKIYGSITSPSEIIYTETDFSVVVAQRSSYLQTLATIFVTRTILIIGLSASRELMLLLESLHASRRHSSSPAYIFLPIAEVGRVLARRLRADFGLEVIAFEPSDGYPEMLQFINFLAAQVQPQSISPRPAAKTTSKKKTSNSTSRVKTLRIVVASPGDVQAERVVVSNVVKELNSGVAKKQKLRLELGMWETDAAPGLHPAGPQGVIDPHLRIESCDILIGIFWRRFGTPTMKAGSGTEHEFNKAYKAYKRNGRPQVMFYFKQKPYTPQSKEETEQWGKVLEFRDNFQNKGLWWSFTSTSDFEKRLREHLIKEISKK